ncbi:MAG: tyrosine-type recombinase/integrase [Deltaproteobacteria bacterium]|nr:tyrosine-type recombinase/integrase [Deltaproteobacteria bacterium]
MGQTKDRMIEDLRLRGYAESTQTKYVCYARKYVAHFMIPPHKLCGDDVRVFFVHLLDQGASPSVRKMYTAAVRFLYEVTLKSPEVVADLPYPKVPVRLPDILSGSEVLQLLDTMTSLKYKMLVMTAYAAGLRVGEACRLQIGDIDSRRMLIHVRAAKGGRDRYVMLAERLLFNLRQYWAATRPPGLYLFPGRNGPLSPYTIQEAIRKVAAGAGLKKRVTMHILRHSFASHMLEMGADIRQIQLVLGHGAIQTTARYTHMTRSQVAAMGSPLDVLGTDEGARLG